MNNRIGILIIGGAAVVVLILLATLVAWGLRANGSASSVDGLDRETGSRFAPRVYDEARTGYVIAELYQDVGMDVRSGVYDQDGVLWDRYWSHDAATQTCSLDLVLADQHGRDEIAPTATLRPTPTRLMAVMPPAFASDGTPVATPYVFVPTPTFTPDPPPTAPPVPTPMVTDATNWNHWKGRPVAIESDGVAVLDLPMDTEVSAWLSVRTGPDSGHNSHTELARMPLPAPHWGLGSAYVALSHASGRILLDSDAVEATYRAAVLHLDISPLSDCAGLRLRWQRSAAVVVSALTDQPFKDWAGRAAPPPTPPPAGIALYSAVGPDNIFDAADFLPANGGTSSTVAGHIRIPDGCDTSVPPVCPDSYIAFAIRADLDKNGLPAIRQTGSPFNARNAFIPAYDPGSQTYVQQTIGGGVYNEYVSLQPWFAIHLGNEWSLTP